LPGRELVVVIRQILGIGITCDILDWCAGRGPKGVELLTGWTLRSKPGSVQAEDQLRSGCMRVVCAACGGGRRSWCVETFGHGCPGSVGLGDMRLSPGRLGRSLSYGSCPRLGYSEWLIGLLLGRIEAGAVPAVPGCEHEFVTVAGAAGGKPRRGVGVAAHASVEVLDPVIAFGGDRIAQLTGADCRPRLGSQRADRATGKLVERQQPQKRPRREGTKQY